MAPVHAGGQVAYEEGRPAECPELLDQAKKVDPGGDTAGAVVDLRQRALRALANKPLKP